MSFDWGEYAGVVPTRRRERRKKTEQERRATQLACASTRGFR
jgi:hypothetical protein